MSGKNLLRQIKRKKAQSLIAQGDFAAAARILEGICQASRHDAEPFFVLGGVYRRLGDPGRAVSCFARVTELHAERADGHFHLGASLLAADRPQQAVLPFRKTIELAPRHEAGYECLAQALCAAGELEAAVAVLRDITTLWPGKAIMYNNLGTILQILGRNEEAVAAYRQSLQLDPRCEPAYDGLGSALLAQGKCEEAMAVDRQGLAIRPANARSHSNLLMGLNYLASIDKAVVYEEHLAWGRAHSRSMPPFWRDIDSDPERRLRVGYISSDFRDHSVAFFIAPLLDAHDRGQVETVCYSNLAQPDSTTQRLAGLADQWRDVSGLDDEQLAALIRKDEIDILVDLNGHTAGNRLPVFLAKPAPIQVTYLGYPNTTGLAQMDYRITDSVADPAGEEVFHSEKLARLPRCFLCYEPMPDAPEVAAPPVLANGFVTFGSFNNLAKINEQVIALWARVLHAVPTARLVLKHRSLNDEEARLRYHALFGRHGIDADRVDLVGHTAMPTEHLAQYGRIDLGLDTFPYNGTTTTCEALWMGVPVLTLAGDRHAGRVGASILSAIGRREWIAHEKEEFVRLAAALAKDEEKLAALRGNLRIEVAASPLCDGSDMASTLENTFRGMWRQWVAGLE